MQKYTSSCIFLQRMNIIFEFYNVPSYITILCTTRANTNTIYYKSAKHHLHIILKLVFLSHSLSTNLPKDIAYVIMY